MRTTISFFGMICALGQKKFMLVLKYFEKLLNISNLIQVTLTRNKNPFPKSLRKNMTVFRQKLGNLVEKCQPLKTCVAEKIQIM